MSLSARTGTEPSTAKAASVLPPRLWAGGRFAWWAALCLVILAYNTSQQVAIQHRILEGSRTLESRVAEARAVTVATNQQLERVAQMEITTASLDVILERMEAVNSAIRAKLAALKDVVSNNLLSASHLDDQVLESSRIISEIIAQSEQLHSTLLRSRMAGGEVTERLSTLVSLQEGINADLAAMRRKTDSLERGSGP